MTDHTTLIKHNIADSRDFLALEFMENCHFYGHEIGNVFCVLYLEYAGPGDELQNTYNAVCTQYFAADRFENALACFRKRAASDMPSRPTEKEGSLDYALPKQGDKTIKRNMNERGLFTGLYDKHGKPIHIGDHIEFDADKWGSNTTNKRVVEFKRGELQILGTEDTVDEYVLVTKAWNAV